MRATSVILICCCQIHVFGQREGARQLPASYSLNDKLVDLKGEPLLTGNSVSADGTPFYSAEWHTASVLLGNGKKLAPVLIRINLEKDEIHFLNQAANGVERIAGKGIVREVAFLEQSRRDSTRFRSGFDPYDGNDLLTFYHVLSTGKMTLLKRTKKILIEEKAFNSATITRRFDTDNSYYVFNGRELQKLKRNKSSLVTLFQDEHKKIEDYLSHKKPALRFDGDLKALFDFLQFLVVSRLPA